MMVNFIIFVLIIVFMGAVLKTVLVKGKKPQLSLVPEKDRPLNEGSSYLMREKPEPGRYGAALHIVEKSGKLPEKPVKTVEPLLNLYKAVEMENIEAVIMLLDRGANVNEKNEQGHTALYIAACRGYSEIVQVLISYGAKVNAENSEGDTALHCAAFSGEQDAVETARLLINHGAEVNIRNKNETTPLRMASFIGDLNMVSLLRQRGARY